MENIHERIRTLRKSEKLTQKEFAKRLLISQSYLSGVENGNEIPTNKFIKLICLEFGVNESWLINGSGNMYSDVYENEKSSLVEVSNSALLKIMTLLTTKSNVEYSYYANCFDLLANTLIQCINWDEHSKLDFFELIQNFVMDLDRAILIINNRLPSIEQHNKGINDDIQQLLNFLSKIDLTNFPENSTSS